MHQFATHFAVSPPTDRLCSVLYARQTATETDVERESVSDLQAENTEALALGFPLARERRSLAHLLI